MGQYHILYNIDKREYVHAHRIGLGLKLVEQCGFEGSTADALWLLVANSNGRGGGDVTEHQRIGSWAGDRIVVQGDYAESDDPAFLSAADLVEFTDISPEVADMLYVAFGTKREPW